MSYESILFTIENGVAVLTLNRPDRLNSFTQAMHGEVRDALDKLQADKSVRVLVLTGAGRGFCAGQDLGDRAVAPGAPGVDLGESVEKFYAPLVMTLRSLPMPVICAVNGVAAGAGANLALACDIVLAAKSASFIEAFCKLGLIPDTGGTWHLPRLIGLARATGLAMLGEKLSAEKAEQWGLIWRAVDDEALMTEAMAMATHFATRAHERPGLHQEGAASELRQHAARPAETGRRDDARTGPQPRLPRRRRRLHRQASRAVQGGVSMHSDPQALAELAGKTMYERDPASQALGMKLDAIRPGYARMSMRVRADMLNGHATCHGGFIFMLADSAFAFACNSHNFNTVGAGCTIDYLAPGREGDLLDRRGGRAGAGRQDRRL